MMFVDGSIILAIVDETSGAATTASLHIFNVSANWWTPSVHDATTRESIFDSNSGVKQGVKSAPSRPIDVEKKTQDSNASRSEAELSIEQSWSSSIVRKV